MTEPLLLVIGNKNYSSWSLRPWLLLREMNIGFEEHRLLLDTPQFASDIASWSPNRRVPALRHGELTIWDSLAICEYVNEAFLHNAGWPVEAPARAIARAVSAEMHSGFQALRSHLPMNCRRRSSDFVVPPDAQRDIERIAAIWRDCRARFGDSGAFLFGRFSIADAMYAPVVLRFLSYGVALDAGTRAYVQTVLGLASMQEWMRDAAAETEQLAATDNIA
ncbi:MAG: glutathione S-transferase family protein [Dokdonella sp.]